MSWYLDKKRRKKYSSAFVVVLLLTCLCCSCRLGKKDEEQPEPITFTMYSADGVEDPWDDPVANQIKEETGVTLDISYPTSNDEDEIALMIATGEYPDLIFAKGDSNQLIENDALIDLSDLIDEYGPHIKELYGDDYEDLRYSEDDPSIYQLCCGEVGNEELTTSGTAQLQWAVLAANNYEIPTTIDEYTQMIRTYTEENPTINGEKTIGISISCSDWYWYITLSDPSGYIADGVSGDGQWIVDTDGTVHYKHTAANQKEYFCWLNEMYDEGILDPEFATQTHERYLEKIASGCVLGLLDSDWDYADAETILEGKDMTERTYAGLPVTIDESVTCASLREQNLPVGWGIGISKSCEDPVRAIKFIDWMCTEEAQILLNWGIEGVNYEYDEDGTRYRTEEEINRAQTDENYAYETGVGFHTYPFPTYGNTVKDSTGNYYRVESEDTITSTYNEEEVKALDAWSVERLTDIFPQPEEFEKTYYTPLWSQTFSTDVSTLVNELDQISWERLVDCIVCEPEEFDEKWESYQQELSDAGVEKAEAELTEQLQKEIKYRKSLEE